MGSQRIPHIEIFNGWEGYSEIPGKQRSQCATYERELRLPIRRPAGKTRGAVLAFKAKIDSWVKTSPCEGLRRSVLAIENRAMLRALTQETMQMRRVREETVHLRKELTAAREELRATTEFLHKSFVLASRRKIKASSYLRAVAALQTC
jgi:hypothetical protein